MRRRLNNKGAQHGYTRVQMQTKLLPDIRVNDDTAFSGKANWVHFALQPSDITDLVRRKDLFTSFRIKKVSYTFKRSIHQNPYWEAEYHAAKALFVVDNSTSEPLPEIPCTPGQEQDVAVVNIAEHLDQVGYPSVTKIPMYKNSHYMKTSNIWKQTKLFSTADNIADPIMCNNICGTPWCTFAEWDNYTMKGWGRIDVMAPYIQARTRTVVSCLFNMQYILLNLQLSDWCSTIRILPQAEDKS